jgi:hypothetical protein
VNTKAGGEINIYTTGDINVKESRMMTWMGGDITLWSDKGNINAGKGSKTQVNTGKPRKVNIGTETEPVWTIVRTPAAVGSGIRAMTYDPDGVGGREEPPLPGDLYLFAPRGIIDFSEAGAEGRSIIAGAQQLLNTQNLSFTGTSVGVPTTTEGTASLGALMSPGAFTDTKKLAEELSGGGSDKKRAETDAERLAESFIPTLLDVRVIAFEEEEEK